MLWRGFSKLLSLLVVVLLLFDLHVSKLCRIKYFAAVLALDVFGVLFSRNDAHFGMFAGCFHRRWHERVNGVALPILARALLMSTDLLAYDRKIKSHG